MDHGGAEAVLQRSAHRTIACEENSFIAVNGLVLVRQEFRRARAILQ